VQALELIGTAEARKVLAGFAKGPRDALVTQEAGAALKRLPRHFTTKTGRRSGSLMEQS
jgi:hypothetical protein